MKAEFKEYLIKAGYKQFTPRGNPSTVYGRIDDVCSAERMDWVELSGKINAVALQYDRGRTKEDQGNMSHRAVINALLRYGEFIRRR